jgi:hypothetical protein
VYLPELNYFSIDQEICLLQDALKLKSDPCCRRDCIPKLTMPVFSLPFELLAVLEEFQQRKQESAVEMMLPLELLHRNAADRR